MQILIPEIYFVEPNGSILGMHQDFPVSLNLDNNSRRGMFHEHCTKTLKHRPYVAGSSSIGR